MNLSNAIVLCK